MLYIAAELLPSRKLINVKSETLPVAVETKISILNGFRVLSVAAATKISVLNGFGFQVGGKMTSHFVN